MTIPTSTAKAIIRDVLIQQHIDRLRSSYTYDAIAERMGCSRNTVYNIAKGYSGTDREALDENGEVSIGIHHKHMYASSIDAE